MENGKKNSVDSTTMMNALELIEAKYLFNLEIDKSKLWCIHNQLFMH